MLINFLDFNLGAVVYTKDYYTDKNKFCLNTELKYERSKYGSFSSCAKFVSSAKLAN